MSRLISLTLQLSLLSWYAYALISFRNIKDGLKASSDNYARNVDNFKYNFFTLWVFISQIVFLVAAVLHEFSTIFDVPLRLQKLLGRFRASIYQTIVFPYTLIVFFVFWGIYNIDRELIFPKVIDTFFPSWLNHTLHTMIIIPLIIESYVDKKYHFVTYERSLLPHLAFIFLYDITFFSVYFIHGVWLYPIAGKLNWRQIILYGIGLHLISVGFFKIGILIQNTRKLKQK